MADLSLEKLEEFLRELSVKSGSGELVSKLEDIFRPKAEEKEDSSDAKES
jgi:hypothetical protein